MNPNNQLTIIYLINELIKTQRTPNGFSEEILRCKAIINTFHLVPPPSKNFFSTLISLVVRAEKYLNVEVGSPFQVTLTLFISVFMSVFMLSNNKINTWICFISCEIANFF